MFKRIIAFDALVIVLYLTIVAISISIVINFQPIYNFFAYHYNLGQFILTDNFTVIKQYKKLLNYLNYPWIQNLNLAIPMSKQAIEHFKDVKNLFLINYIFTFLGSLVSGYFLIILYKKKRVWLLIRPLRYFIIFLLVLSCLMVLNFNSFFIIFHKIFFKGNGWLFDPNIDPIINILPESFFMASFFAVAMLILSITFGLIVLGRRNFK